MLNHVSLFAQGRLLFFSGWVLMFLKRLIGLF